MEKTVWDGGSKGGVLMAGVGCDGYQGVVLAIRRRGEIEYEVEWLLNFSIDTIHFTSKL